MTIRRTAVAYRTSCDEQARPANPLAFAGASIPIIGAALSMLSALSRSRDGLAAAVISSVTPGATDDSTAREISQKEILIVDDPYYPDPGTGAVTSKADPEIERKKTRFVPTGRGNMAVFYRTGGGSKASCRSAAGHRRSKVAARHRNKRACFC